jgi:hypothetical protein
MPRYAHDRQSAGAEIASLGPIRDSTNPDHRDHERRDHKHQNEHQRTTGDHTQQGETPLDHSQSDIIVSSPWQGRSRAHPDTALY